jgi:hypothetical protein
MAPGINFPPADAVVSVQVHETLAPPTTYEPVESAAQESLSSGVYYNPRLDPKNYLEGPLSWNPATRLRQMLARPGIVVSFTA